MSKCAGGLYYSECEDIAESNGEIFRLRQENADLRRQLDAANETISAMQDVLEELVEVAELRGDTILPPAEEDPKFWTELMQTAWDNAKFVLLEGDKRDE